MTFPRARKGRHGYDIDEVEEFLEDARRAYTADNPAASLVTADSIRTTAFSMRRAGYSTTHVDAALERLEDAFAARERDREIAQVGDEAWYANARTTAQAILGLLLALVGTMGDLTESLIKRDLGVKDISGWLPGHGGFLDRLDSMLPAAAVTYVAYLIVGVS